MQIDPRYDPSVIRAERHTHILATTDDTVLASVEDPELFEVFIESLAGFAERHIVFDKEGVGTIYRKWTIRYSIPADVIEDYIAAQGQGSENLKNGQE